MIMEPLVLASLGSFFAQCILLHFNASPLWTCIAGIAPASQTCWLVEFARKTGAYL